MLVIRRECITTSHSSFVTFIGSVQSRRQRSSVAATLGRPLSKTLNVAMNENMPVFDAAPFKLLLEVERVPTRAQRSARIVQSANCFDGAESLRAKS